MYGAGNPQMAALGALGALGGTLRDMLMSPVSRWGQTTLTHKVIAAGAGAGLAYYLHKKGMADYAVALVGLGGAYATSALMHSGQVIAGATNGGALATSQVAGALPPGQVQDMAAQANAVMGNGMSGGRWGALAPSGAPAPHQQVIGAPAAPSPGGSSKWAILG